MGDSGIYAINAVYLFRSPSTGSFEDAPSLFLCDIVDGDIIERLFYTVARGEEEWHIKLNEDEVREAAKKLPEVCDACGEGNPNVCEDCREAECTAKEIIESITALSETYSIPTEYLWGLTWVW